MKLSALQFTGARVVCQGGSNTERISRVYSLHIRKRLNSEKKNSTKQRIHFVVRNL
ncbi:hypothetical protein L798_04858 [Zootermopsis nevadensis]|uniref:Uncharacterized protein n=1 Tax=Zootermopsis nevadensis TaxID=136037 RepID=A0A067RJL0_ZOONE|nr:hypothetical protein L798_04858 [Zootermopsis nevadensis]